MLSSSSYLSIGGFEISVAFTFRRECPGFDIIVVGVERRSNDFESVRVHSQEFWFEAGIKTEHILVDQNLSAHMWTGPNTYSWNLEKVRYCSRTLRGYTLEHDREASGIFQLARLGGQNFHSRICASLYFHSSQPVN